MDPRRFVVVPRKRVENRFAPATGVLRQEGRFDPARHNNAFQSVRVILVPILRPLRNDVGLSRAVFLTPLRPSLRLPHPPARHRRCAASTFHGSPPRTYRAFMADINAPCTFP